MKTLFWSENRACTLPADTHKCNVGGVCPTIGKEFRKSQERPGKLSFSALLNEQMFSVLVGFGVLFKLMVTFKDADVKPG